VPRISQPVGQRTRRGIYRGRIIQLSGFLSTPDGRSAQQRIQNIFLMGVYKDFVQQPKVWPDVKKMTAMRRKVNKTSVRPLVDTGALRDSFKVNVDSPGDEFLDASLATRSRQRMVLRLYGTVPNVLNAGSIKNKVPARHFWYWKEREIKQAEKYLSEVMAKEAVKKFNRLTIR
jgi:hypothetical protein